MTRTRTALLIACVLCVSFAWRVVAQPPPGFSGVYDASNTALRVNTVAGAATGAVYPDGTNWGRTGTSANVSVADTTTDTTPMGALASVTTVNLAGNVGAVFQVQSGGTLVGVLTHECSFDGGTNYPVAVQLTDPSTGQDAPTVTISSGQATTPYTMTCPFGASHARMRVSTYTSGTVNMVARATVGGFPNSVP